MQLFSKLFDEVEKIRCWKVQTDSDTGEKERKLQESKRAIETQRRTIQELQVKATSLVCLLLLMYIISFLKGVKHLITEEPYRALVIQFDGLFPIFCFQFCNESLSMKLQEQVDDTENLRNK